MFSENKFAKIEFIKLAENHPLIFIYNYMIRIEYLSGGAKSRFDLVDEKVDEVEEFYFNDKREPVLFTINTFVKYVNSKGFPIKYFHVTNEIK